MFRILNKMNEYLYLSYIAEVWIQLCLQVLVECEVEAPDPGLLIIPQRDALASGLEPLLLQLQVASVLIVNGS